MSVKPTYALRPRPNWVINLADYSRADSIFSYVSQDLDPKKVFHGKIPQPSLKKEYSATPYSPLPTP
ncbi:hypothetical protein WA1_27240 [Scytonema hofmannii PCC 7110]|uniref:Uncharacterized protein n=1 Tax=Scytonema hofmannii PCC 7110 TaxID=128403 RepID=A0A139X6C9_9CYAN|nr:hypothetical protein WA1_27240 [Scytonema hofmannii PCC 7110]